MISIVHKEWGCINQGVVVVVVHKFHHWKEVGLIVLSVGTVHVEVSLHPLVVVLHLTSVDSDTKSQTRPPIH